MINSKINDCWNTIGTWGKEEPRCEKLDSLIHCRNCSVYSDAGRLLLNRSPEANYLDEWTTNLSKPREDENTSLYAALVFRLGKEWFAIQADIVREITHCDKHHSLPHRKNQVIRGLVNVRGELLPSVSLGYLFNLDKRDIEVNSSNLVLERYIVISDKGNYYAFPASEVKSILKYDNDTLKQTPSTINNTTTNFVRGVIEYDNINIGLLDIDLLFNALHRNIS